MLLNEIFDTKVPVEQWRRVGHKDIGRIHIDEEEFHIILEESHYKFEDKTIKTINFINAAFAKIVDGPKLREDPLITSKNAAKVLGAIYNAIIFKMNGRDDSEPLFVGGIEAIVFVARDNVTERMDLYNRMTSNMFNPFTDVIENVHLPDGGRMTILLKNTIRGNLAEAFKQHLTTLNK